MEEVSLLSDLRIPDVAGPERLTADEDWLSLLSLTLGEELTPGIPFVVGAPALVPLLKGLLEEAIAVLKVVGAWLETKALAAGASAQSARILVVNFMIGLFSANMRGWKKDVGIQTSLWHSAHTTVRMRMKNRESLKTHFV